MPICLILPGIAGRVASPHSQHDAGGDRSRPRPEATSPPRYAIVASDPPIPFPVLRHTHSVSPAPPGVIAPSAIAIAQGKTESHRNLDYQNPLIRRQVVGTSGNRAMAPFSAPHLGILIPPYPAESLLIPLAPVAVTLCVTL